MSGTGTHHLTESVVGTGVGSIADVSKTLVNEKYTLIDSFAAVWSDATEDYILDLQSAIESMTDVDTSISIAYSNLNPSISLSELLKDAPESPIKNSDYNDLDLPTSFSFDYIWEEYTSSLKDSLRSRLKTIIDNNEDTGLTAAVESAMFSRETEREELVNQDAKDEVADDWGQRNWEIPSGGLFDGSIQIETEYQNKRLDRSRTITEETRKMAQNAQQNAYAEANKIEASELTYWARKQEGLLTKAVELFNSGLRILELKYRKLEAKVNVYRTEADAFAATMQGQRAVADIEIAYARARVEQDRLRVEEQVAEIGGEIDQMKAKWSIGTDSIKALATIAAQITASALSSFTASAYVSSQYQGSVSNNTSIQEQHTHDYTES
jgi:hypothetical protein